jgi:hypothetical protein
MGVSIKRMSLSLGKRRYFKFNALFNASSKTDSLNGFKRQPMTPSCISSCDARSARAVMKIVGMLWPRLNNSRHSSGPDIPGIAMSRIRHVDLPTKPDWRKSFGVANTSDANPNSLRRSGKDSRTESSSSTTDTKIAAAFIYERLIESKFEDSVSSPDTSGPAITTIAPRPICRRNDHPPSYRAPCKKAEP